MTGHMIARQVRTASAIVMLLASLGLSTVPTRAQEPPSLPGGASSIQETFGDWRVVCQIVRDMKQCSMSQQQVRQDGQRVVAIELQPGPDQALAGTLVLPFGLLLDAGVTLRVDELPALPPLSFHTCLPVGCVARVTFEGDVIQALRGGATLHLQARTADTEQDFLIQISLNGFPAAADRLADLMQN